MTNYAAKKAAQGRVKVVVRQNELKSEGIERLIEAARGNRYDGPRSPGTS